MTSTGTYAFNPDGGDIIVNAFSRLQIRRAALTADHMQDAALESNLLLTEWASKQPLLWKSETQNLGVLVQGTATYAPAARTVDVLIAYIRTGTGSSQIDRTIGPLSTVEYQSMPTKTQQGTPTSFWFNRQISPTITLWPTPDNGGPYTLIVQTVSQVQDMAVIGGTTLDTPYRFYDAFVAGLAYRLARIYAPKLEQIRKQDAMDAWNNAANNDVESVPVYMIPGLSPYYR